MPRIAKQTTENLLPRLTRRIFSYADLTKALAGSKLLGFGSAMDLAGYLEFFGDAPADIPYYRCFRDVVCQCGKWAK